VEGFGGFRVKDGVPHFATMLPSRWSSYAFKLQFRGRTLEVTVSAQGTAVHRLEGDPLAVVVNGDSIEI